MEVTHPDNGVEFSHGNLLGPLHSLDHLLLVLHTQIIYTHTHQTPQKDSKETGSFFFFFFCFSVLRYSIKCKVNIMDTLGTQQEPLHELKLRKVLQHINYVCTGFINVNGLGNHAFTHSSNTDKKNPNRNTHTARHKRTLTRTDVLKATLTKTSVLFTQNPNVISHANANMHVQQCPCTHSHAQACAHTHTHKHTHCQY